MDGGINARNDVNGARVARDSDSREDQEAEQGLVTPLFLSVSFVTQKQSSGRDQRGRGQSKAETRVTPVSLHSIDHAPCQ